MRLVFGSVRRKAKWLPRVVIIYLRWPRLFSYKKGMLRKITFPCGTLLWLKPIKEDKE